MEDGGNVLLCFSEAVSIDRQPYVTCGKRRARRRIKVQLELKQIDWNDRKNFAYRAAFKILIIITTLIT